MALVALGGAALVAGAVVKLLSSRPRFQKLGEGRAYGTPEGAEPDAAWVSTYKTGVTVPFDGCDTLYAVFQFACRSHANRKAAGTRELIRTVHDGKFEKLVLGDYKWLTYAQLAQRVEHAATGLAAWAGLEEQAKVSIYAETSANWLARKRVAAEACWRQNLAVVTVYATLGPDGVKHGLNQTGARVVFTDAKLFACVLAVAPSCRAVTHLVVFGTLSPPQLAELAAVRPDLAVITFDALVALGAAAPAGPVAARPPAPSDVAVIMYTSGTTGPPKGVVLPHACVLASCAGLKDAGRFTPADVYLAYLPLAHIMEVAGESVMLATGCAVGYGSPQTLTDTGLKLAPGVRGDAPTLKPTFVVFAPLVLDRVRQAVQAKVAAGSPGKRKLFERALAAGGRDFDAGMIGAPPLWNALVFKKVQALIGGRVALIVTGSAPLSADTQRFIQVCFNCPVRQGYGLTETCSAATIAPFDSNAHVAGAPLSSTKLRLRDWPEGGYLLSDAAKPGVGRPRGEVLVGGPCVCAGYYQNPEAPDAELEAKNASEFSTDAAGVRWFHTGDVGEITAEGFLRIVDRKKDLVKLQQGEYVALSQVENAMKHSHYVENCLCYALSTKSHTVALVVPAAKPLRAWAEAAGLAQPDTPLPDLCALPAAAAEVLRSVRAAAAGKTPPFTVPAALGLVADPWTPENELLTAAMKLKRPQIVHAHAAQLDGLYAALS